MKLNADQLREVLRGQAMGDENCIELLIQHNLAIAEENQGLAAQNQTLLKQNQVLAQQLQGVSGAYKYREKVYEKAAHHPVLDRRNHPTGYAVAAKIDTKIAKRHPDWDEDKRLDKVVEEAEEIAGTTEEDLVRKEGIQQICSANGKQGAARRLVSRRDEDSDKLLAEAQSAADERDEQERAYEDEIPPEIADHSQAIADMALARLGRKVAAGERGDFINTSGEVIPRRSPRQNEFPR
jgi:hypothetical protein